MFDYESVVAPQGIPLQAQVEELRRRAQTIARLQGGHTHYLEEYRLTLLGFDYFAESLDNLAEFLWRNSANLGAEAQDRISADLTNLGPRALWQRR